MLKARYKEFNDNPMRAWNAPSCLDAAEEFINSLPSRDRLINVSTAQCHNPKHRETIVWYWKDE